MVRRGPLILAMLAMLAGSCGGVAVARAVMGLGDTSTAAIELAFETVVGLAAGGLVGGALVAAADPPGGGVAGSVVAALAAAAAVGVLGAALATGSPGERAALAVLVAVVAVAALAAGIGVGSVLWALRPRRATRVRRR